jgi:hypothetical protein
MWLGSALVVVVFVPTLRLSYSTQLIWSLLDIED